MELKTISFVAIIRLFASVFLSFGLLSNALAADRLMPGESLVPGDGLQSPNGQYRLEMQHDGNLVIYNARNQAEWHTHTNNTDAYHLAMQHDGNLVLYSADSTPRWHTHTYNYRDAGVFAVMQDDGNFVLYTGNGVAIWASKGVNGGATRSVNRDQFFSGVRTQFGRMNQSQVDGINFLLAKMEADTRPAIANSGVWLRQIAYMFATIRHEVANTYQPITEFSNTTCRRYDGGCRYKGRGYVQLTHRYNYRKLSPVVGVDLVAAPERALEPEISYTVTSYGMFNGSFTGRRLGTYIREGSTDYYNARRVVNGTDKANLIAGYASTFQGILETATK